MVKPARAIKHPRKVLTSQEKLAAIYRVKNCGESKASVARDIGVPESTFRGWCKSEHKIRDSLNNSASSSPSVNTKVHRLPNYENSNNCSKDETINNPAKRVKLDSPNPQDHLELITRLVVADTVPLSQAQFLAQLGLIPANQTPNRQPTTPPAPAPKTCGLVENGLVNTTSSDGKSIAASTSKGLSLVVEAPVLPIPSPLEHSRKRRLTETSDDHTSTSPESTKNNQRLIDENLQNNQERLGQVVVPFSPPTSQSTGSSFWQSYKLCDVSATQKDSDKKVKNVKKSPSEAKAVLDLIFSCNNNCDKENGCKNLNNNMKTKSDDDTYTIARDEALNHGKIFAEWLELGNNPSVRQVDIIRLRCLIDSIKKTKTQPKHCKRSRK